MNQSRYIYLTLLLSITLLTGCSGGGSDNSTSGSGDDNVAGGGRGGSQNGFLSLSITDAAIDGASEVRVQFDGVVLKPTANETPITLSFKPPMSINLLALQGTNSIQLVINKTLPAGRYDWIRLNITASDDGILDSYIKLDDNSVHDLDIPSGSESGLKITGGLEIIANTPTDMTIDFDLRKSIVLTGSGKYILKPVLKLMDNAETASITGTVKISALTDSDCPDTDPATGNAVYLYEGLNITADDVDNVDAEPVASAIPALNNATGEYEYSLGFLPLGKYTAAFTCQAELDDPATDDAIIFSRPKNINLSRAGTVKTVTFR